ncbi:rhamnan synthesis F family protein [Pantoea sp. Fr+CA_20]|uniref:rhamnan synthesis F family protein n=1 Tax=Pantoea TaxID=53335 RepID=UPI002119A87B|nr:rhamnan synthesis F family protein [Pantoea sp. Fr+CA_20]
MKTVAVVAHYDVNNIADDYLLPLFSSLFQVCDKIVVVTTSGIEQASHSKLSSLGNLEIITRENVGYDFLSYKTGIDSIADLDLYDRLLVLNDSFYTSKNFNLEKILIKSEAKDIFGLTSTNQFRFHLQSYFLVFNKKALLSKWFFKFWNGVFSYKRKIKIIFNYEMGLTSSALHDGLTVGSVISSNHKENPCHKNVEELFSKVGIVKIDVLRNNIAYFDVNRLDDVHVIKSHLARTTSAYSHRKLEYGKNIQAGDNFFEFSNISERETDVAVIMHIFYPEIAREIYHYIERIPYDFDIFITVPEESYIPVLIDLFMGLSCSIHIAVSENKGRDVYPFIKIMQSFDFRKYSMVLKLHTKKSKYSELGDAWRRNIFSGLLPPSAELNSLRLKFLNDKIGIVAPLKDYLSNDDYWGANKERVFLYAQRLGLDEEEIDLFFVGGTMFWFRPDSLYPVIDLISDTDFEEELNQQDGTFAHAFERLTCLSALSQGYKVIDIDEFKEVDSSMVKSNKVIVLK